MSPDRSLEKAIRAALERERRVNLHRHPIDVGCAAGEARLEGEVADLAAKKTALALAAGIGGVRSVLDRLRVVPSEPRGDGAVRDSLRAALSASRELEGCDIRPAVADGVITLEGTAGSLAHKRLAGVLAWWTPGCRDVVDALEVSPPQEDNDGELLDAYGLALEVDPTLEPDGIAALCDRGVITLKGTVRSDGQRRRAEQDAWSIFGVKRVVNELEVRG